MPPHLLDFIGWRGVCLKIVAVSNSTPQVRQEDTKKFKILAMKFSSIVVNNGVVASLNFDSLLLKAYSISPQASSPNWVRLHFPISTSLVAGGFVCSRKKNSVITCSRKTEPDAEKSTSEEVTSRSQMLDSIIGTEGSDKDSSSDDSEKETSTPGNYVTSVRTVAFCVLSAAAFGVGLGFKDGVGKASEFFAGYLLEQSLSVDNLFVFVLIFKYFKVPFMYQNRVLSYGIAGAVVFRLSIILLGTATLQKFEAVNLLLAAILLFSAFKLFSDDGEDSDLSDNFIVKTCQKFIPVTSNYDGDRFITIEDGIRKATPLFLTVAVIELSDIAFAVDSIPAVFGVTRDPFVVFSSNLFAILGLRSLYTLISESMGELEYLQPAIAIVLGFIGSKMIADFFGYHISTEVSLGVVASCLTGGVLLSLLKKSD